MCSFKWFIVSRNEWYDIEFLTLFLTGLNKLPKWRDIYEEFTNRAWTDFHHSEFKIRIKESNKNVMPTFLSLNAFLCRVQNSA